MTLAPKLSATSDVRSVDPLSTTITSSTNSGIRDSTFSIPCSSLRHGMMTVIFWFLYIPPLHQNTMMNHAYLLSVDRGYGGGGRRGSGRYQDRVPVANVGRARPVPGDQAGARGIRSSCYGPSESRRRIDRS